jgi:tetratricopeptide (TPR) repeat protein
MRFLAPAWLWVLLALPLLYWFVVHDEKRRQKQFERFADRAVWRTLVPEMDPGARVRKMGMWLAAVAFVILALARPQWGTHEESIKATGLDIMVVLDVSNSMETEDVIPSRLKKSRHLIKSVVDQLKGDRVGIVAFAASSYLACPLTTDTDYVLEMLQILGPKMISSQGTDIGLGLETARKALDRGAEEMTGAGTGDNAAAAANMPQPSHVVLLISDGEDHEEGAIEAAKALKENGTKFYVMGVGTEKGGPVPLRDDVGNLLGYKKDRKGDPVVSTFHPDELMKIAQAGGGRYWNATTNESEVGDMLQDMGALNRTDYAERRYLVYEDRFQFPLAIALILIFLEISLPVRKIRKSSRDLTGNEAESGGALSKPALGILVFLLFGLGGGSEARAVSLLKDQPLLDAYLENEKGLKAFKDGKTDEAGKEFGTAQALDPNLPELQFNQGVIQMQKGDVESAVRDFGDAAKGAQERGDARLQGSSLYNLGGALSKKGDIQGAVRSYLGAIGAAEQSKDASLEADARRNIQLLIQERQKQKQQQQDQKKQGKQSDKQDDKKDSQDNKDQQSQNQNQQQNKNGQQDKKKQYEDPSQIRQRQFKSPKLSKDDAERVMSELSNREKDLQARLKKQNGTPQQQTNAKDW